MSRQRSLYFIKNIFLFFFIFISIEIIHLCHIEWHSQFKNCLFFFFCCSEMIEKLPCRWRWLRLRNETNKRENGKEMDKYFVCAFVRWIYLRMTLCEDEGKCDAQCICTVESNDVLNHLYRFGLFFFFCWYFTIHNDKGRTLVRRRRRRRSNLNIYFI